MNGLRSVIKPDGSVHLESECGTGSLRMRMDLTTGEMSTVMNSGSMSSVTSSSGGFHTEYTVGNMRFNSETGTTEYLL